MVHLQHTHTKKINGKTSGIANQWGLWVHHSDWMSKCYRKPPLQKNPEWAN
uniref:Uncharacterized protein n=1 Tax=Solanum tuberosum TaxID=4113 RepID=M1B696_SOLTU